MDEHGPDGPTGRGMGPAASCPPVGLTIASHRTGLMGKPGRSTIHIDPAPWYYNTMASPACSICQRPDLAAIDAALSIGAALVPTAAQFGASKSSLGRHRAGCLAPKLAAASRIVQPVRESREPVERAKAIAAGDTPSPQEVLTLTGLLDRLVRSLDRLEGAADGAANDNLYAALAAVSGQLHRGIADAAKLQGICVEPEMQQQTK